MDLSQAHRLATSLMVAHEVDWDFAWDRAKKRAGQTNFTTRTITLSKHLTELCTEEQVRQTVLHEIAHVLAGPGHGHGPVWQQKAREIGASPRRSTGPDFPRTQAPWQAVCSAGHTHHRHRRPKNPVSCGLCSSTYQEKHRLVWQRVAA